MPSLDQKNRLERVLGLTQRAAEISTGAKTALFFAALALVALAVVLLDPRPSLRHVNVAFLSGGERGNYHAVVDKLATEVRRRNGRIGNLASAGSIENVSRLTAARKACDAHFALVQDGTEWPKDHPLELIGRLPRPEAVVVLGRNADAIRSPEQLRGLRIGIGPVGSGTEYLARRILAPLAELDMAVSTQPIVEQLDKLQRGELDLGAMVIDEEAALLVEAVRDRRLQILGFPEAGSLARRLPFARVGHIDAGRYDYVRRLPPENKPVLFVDTLVIGNGCASTSATQGVLSALAELYPTFVRHNRNEPNLTGLPLSTVAKTFYQEEGPDLVGQYAPWVVDILPTATWVQLILGVSILFNGMGLWHRFRLWRIDADRVDVEREIPALFGQGITVGEIAKAPVADRHRSAETRAKLDDIIARFQRLADRSRRQSMSVLVPMGQEMAYRYQESLIDELLFALRAFRERVSDVR